ncbi:MAG TPA: signal peptidase I [Ktedonobacterales bacterium]|jgi:signal peptidase I|nr:signal peptidase I [Ktedonobacterales bacterium]
MAHKAKGSDIGAVERAEQAGQVEQVEQDDRDEYSEHDERVTDDKQTQSHAEDAPGYDDERPSDSRTVARQQALLREITTTLLVTLALFIGLHYSAQAVPLDGPSMQPGLHTDERVLVNSLAYTFHGPARGDVIVFHPPIAPNERYIKRVIGLPGDTITLTANQVIVNGVPLDETYITPAPPGETENPEPETIKLNESQYFVMGDNRTNSEDSRFFGPITQSGIIGKAEFVVWPLTSIHAIDTYPSEYQQVPDVRAPLAPLLAWLSF